MKKRFGLSLLVLFFVFALVPSANASAKSKIYFSKSKVTIDIYKGTSTTLSLKKKGVTGHTYYTSSKPKVATVSSHGYVVARGKMGKTTITARCGKYTAKCTVTVKSTKVLFELPSYQFSVTKGYYSGLNYLTKGTFAKPTWSSSNTRIATVNSIGRITGKGLGTTTITGKVGGKTRKVTVHVLANGVVGKAYKDFLAQELVPAGVNDIPTEQKYVAFTFTNIDQDGIGELAVFAKKGGAGYTPYNNGTIYTYRNGKMLKLGNVTCGIESPCTWQLHMSHNNVVISTLTHLVDENGLYREFYYQLKNDKLSMIAQTSMTKDNWCGPYKNFTYANGAGTVITKNAYQAILDKLLLGSSYVNYFQDDNERIRNKYFGE